MKQMYVYVTPFLPRYGEWRGRFGLDFIKALVKTGEWEVFPFTPGDGGSYDIEGVTVYTFKVRFLPSNMFPFLFSKYNKESFVKAAEGAGVKWEAVSIVHANCSKYVMYAEAVREKSPSVLTLLQHHDLQSYGLTNGILHTCGIYNLWMYNKLRKLYNKIDVHVFISEACKNSFMSAPNTSWTEYLDYKKQMLWPKIFHCKSVDVKRSLVLHNGVDTTVFFSDVTQNRRDKNEELFIIGCVGNFELLKGQMKLLEAINILRAKGYNARVEFVGTGPQLEKCKAYAKRNKIPVAFHREFDREHLANFYRSIHLFVLPSSFEGFGCVYAEAWSCGTAFIACAGQGIADLIPQETHDKWLARPTPQDIASKIENYIISHPTQTLNKSISIDDTVKSFVRDLQRIVHNM